jgi:hypothetical protein
MTTAVAPNPFVVDDTEYNTSYSNCDTAVRQNLGGFHFLYTDKQFIRTPLVLEVPLIR